MKKKTGIATSLILLFLIIFSCEQEDQIDSFKATQSEIRTESSNDPLNILRKREEIDELNCGETIKKELIAGQHIVVGDLLIKKEEDLLKITYDLSGTDWWLKETHLFVGNIDQAPFTKSGNPKIGNFPYHGDHDMIKKFSFTIALDELDDCFSIITHASVSLIVDGNETANETAFGHGDNEFTGNRWGWYSDVCKSDCEEDTDNEEDENESSDAESTTESNSSDQASDDTSDVADENSDGCMDAYAYSSKQNSLCFLNDFDSWGWTNKVISNDEHYMPGGVTYTYPLYASAYDCAIDNSILIGEVTINVSGGDSVLYASISINLSKQELSITDIDIYADETTYPLDDSGAPTIAFDQFDISLNSMNEKTYNVNWFDWFDQTNFIVHVKVCPEEILQ